MSKEPEAPSVDRMEFTLDLESDLGIEFDISPLTKQAIGNAVAEQIRRRTRNEQRPLNGSKFAAYSEKYAKKKGVDVNDVDLTLFRDMLDAITVTDIGNKSITIGIDSSREIPKSFNHHTGDTVPPRPFFGIEDKELRRITRGLQGQIKTDEERFKERRNQDAEIKRLQEEAIEELAAKITGELFDFGRR